LSTHERHEPVRPDQRENLLDLPSAAEKRREKSGEITRTGAPFVLPLTAAQNVCRQLNARVDAELIESRSQVRFHRSFTDLQPLGNVGGSLARSDKLGDLVLAPGQARSHASLGLLWLLLQPLERFRTPISARSLRQAIRTDPTNLNSSQPNTDIPADLKGAMAVIDRPIDQVATNSWEISLRTSNAFEKSARLRCAVSVRFEVAVSRHFQPESACGANNEAAWGVE
jgi:hypothetical protein